MEEDGRKNYIYILRCGDGSLYTGWTTDLERRFRMHQEGRGAKYTRGRQPLEMVYSERCESKSAALKREAAVKQMSRAQKEKLIKISGVSAAREE